MTKAARIVSVVEVAQSQFKDWCASFRQATSGKELTIRMFAGDALAFAHSLQYTMLAETNQPTSIRRDTFHLETIHLDGGDYHHLASKYKAPLVFNVIDTSNLIDHLGPVNLLCAASPLLDNDASSCLYTESLVKREKDYKAYITDLLSGDFATMSLLLDLSPVEYWTNSSTSSSADEVILNTFPRHTDRADHGQMPVPLTWKRLSPSFRNRNLQTIDPRLKLDSNDLAHVLYRVYQRMFQNEDMHSLFSDLNLLKMKRNSILYYNRGSFAVFLHQLRSRVVVDWDRVMLTTLQLIEIDSTVMMGRNYIQELYLSLHLLNLHSVDILLKPNFQQYQSSEGIGSWKDLPGVVCISMKVPREVLSVLTGPKPTHISTPIVHCIVQSSPHSSFGR